MAAMATMVDFEAILGCSAPAWVSTVKKSLRKGKADSALETAEQAQKDYLKRDDKKGEGAALLVMANAASEAGSFDVCVRMASEALSSFQVTKNKVGESAALVIISNACYCSGQYEEAVTRAEDAVAMAEKCGATLQAAYGKKAVANAALARLQAKENIDSEIAIKALEAAEAASNAFRDSEDKAEVAEVASLLAQAYLFSGNSNMALANAKMAQRIYQAESDTASEARALLIVAMALHKEGSSDVAMRELEGAASLFLSIGDEIGQEAAQGLMEEYQYLFEQEKDDFTQRVVQRFHGGERTGAEAHSFSAVRPHNFMPSKEPIDLGPAVVKIVGLMGRSAGPPKQTSEKSVVQNKASLYNITWEKA